jgi:hypothetical protein
MLKDKIENKKCANVQTIEINKAIRKWKEKTLFHAKKHDPNVYKKCYALVIKSSNIQAQG